MCKTITLSPYQTTKNNLKLGIKLIKLTKDHKMENVN